MKPWRKSIWGDEISLEYGKGIRGYADRNGPYRVFGSNGAVGWADVSLAPGPGVILGRKGAYRGVRYSADPFYVIDTAYYVSIKSELDMRWLYYAIIHHKLGEIDDGSPIPSTTRSAVYVREVSVPELSEQKAIAAVLTALDDKIELNRRMNETLEASARALFRDWFVDFGPTRAKADGRPAYLDQGLWATFPNNLNEDGTPEGWGWSALSDVLVLQRGFDLPKGTRTDGLFPVIAASGPSGTHNEMRVAGPGVCTGRSGVLGGVFYVTQDFWPLNTSLWVKEYPNATPLYAYHALLEMDLASFNAGSAVPTLNRNHIHGMPVVKPPMNVIRSFDTTAARLYAMREANLQENTNLTKTRDTLLPKLMSGAIRVRDAESAVAALC
nr:restriction endonuclease subunit S [Sphingomonas sp. H160509]